MLFDMLILFVVITFICLLLTIFMVEKDPMMTIPIIVIGIIFSVLCTYGMYDVEYFYVGYNSTAGNTTTNLYSADYGDPYGYIFMLLFYVFVMFFIRAGWNLWKDAIKTEGQIDYRMNRRRR